MNHRRGTNHPVKRARIDTKVSKVYKNARQKLFDTMQQFSFIKVVEIINVPPSNGKPAFYHGIGITQLKDKKQAEVFFDKGSRMRYTSLIEIGPAKLVDTAVGRDHFSSTPQVGDILIGVLADNLRKSRIPKVLRSWSRHGDLIKELLRIFEFGTQQSELSIRKLLTQSESLIAESIKSRPTSQNAADDLWMLTKTILWGDTRVLAVLTFIETNRKLKVTPDEKELEFVKSVKLNMPAYEFVSGIAFRFEDADVLKDYNEHFEEDAPAIQNPGAQYAILQPYILPTPAIQPQQIYEAGGGTSPPYIPSSPQYAPKSPLYGATSPMYGTQNEIVASTSPPYGETAAEQKTEEDNGLTFEEYVP